MGVSDKFVRFVAEMHDVCQLASEARYGGAVGAGIDFGITPNIVLGVDYVHGFLGSRDITFTSVTTGLLSRTDRIRQDVDIVTGRLNSKLDDTYKNKKKNICVYRLSKAGLAPAFFCLRWNRPLMTAAAKREDLLFLTRFLHANRFPLRLKTLWDPNNPLMVRRRHWKCQPVLPTFQLSLIGAPDLPALRPTSCVSRAWKCRYG